MGKKSKKTKRKSELKIIFFIILVAAALFIVSTYAWFSTQKNVSITNLNGTVEVAEGLEISLDALNWANEIVLGEDMSIMDNAYTGHKNLSPSELLPVSTLGKVYNSSGNVINDPDESTMTDIKMIRGKITNSKELSEIVSMDESVTNSEAANYPGYFAFDIFLKNSSKQNDYDDNLQLNYDSSLHISADGNDQVGLQNTARVAFAKYGSGEIISQTGNKIVRSGVSDVMASQETILKETGTPVAGADRVYITDVAIWEPNAGDHVEYIVNNNNKITWSSGDATKYVKDLGEGKTGFATNTQIPTYALTTTAATNKDVVIENIYAWDGSESYLEKQVTLQTDKRSESDYRLKDGVENLISTGDDSGNTPFAIAPNCVVRLRVYVWLEGQDVDCINYASHGGGVTVNIGLVKGSTPGDDENTIIDDLT